MPNAPAPRPYATSAFRTRTSWTGLGVMFMVRRLEVDYERGARLDESLTVETEVLEVGGATARLRQTVRDKDGICAALTVRLACVRVEGNKPGRIPPRGGKD